MSAEIVRQAKFGKDKHAEIGAGARDHRFTLRASGAHVEVRKIQVRDHELEAVIFPAGGVFEPYPGVSTAVLISAEGGRTDQA